MQVITVNKAYKRLLQASLLIILLLPLNLAFAQFNQGVLFAVTSNLDEPFTLSNQNFEVSVVTTTGFSDDSPEPPYAVHLWVTFGPPASDEQPVDSAFPGFIVPDPNNPIPDPVRSELTSGNFRLPVIGNASASNLLEPGLSAAEIVGGDIYITTCLDTDFGNANPNDGICNTRQITIHPDEPEFLESPALQEANRATVYWERLPTDSVANNQRVGNSHRLTLTNQNELNDSVEITINDGINTAVFDDEERNRLILTASPISIPGFPCIPSPRCNPDDQEFLAEAGVAYRTTIQACTDTNVCGEGLSIDNVTRFATNSDSFTASEGNRDDAVRVRWVRHSPETDSYVLTRCEENIVTSCIDIPLNNNATSFLDETVVPETHYVYTVFACVGGDCIPTGKTNAGFSSLIQPDIFEVDNSPFQLTRPEHTVGELLNQTRSFHLIDDQDWARIEIETGTEQLEVRIESGIMGVDTQLTLFDSEGNMIACAANTPGVLTSQALLRVPVTPGEYFVRSEQQRGTSTVENRMLVREYQLITRLLNNTNDPQSDFPCAFLSVEEFPMSIPIITPILNLLLSD